MQLDPSALPPPPAPTGLSDAAATPVGILHGDEQQAYARARVEVGQHCHMSGWGELLLYL
jgi:hypothetical protein